jgi:TolB-like protein
LSVPDIFLSYNREDQAAAKRFAEAFEAEGFSVWWDVTLRSGEAYDQVTEEALRTAKAVVVLWSAKSVVSRWVRAEATLADRNRTLVPARIEPCDLPIMFELTQTADLAHWHGNPRDPAWGAFLTDVRRLTGTNVESVPVVQSGTTPIPASRSKRPSIAILPFINRSGLAEDDIFADGMVEDLTAALSVSRKTKVIAASATAIYRTGARDLRQIGHELGVRYVLEGNLRRVGTDLRVTAQLVEAEDSDIIWSQKFDRPLAELAALQEDLVSEVAAHLGGQIERAEIENALRKPGDVSAWEAVLRAGAHLSRSSRTGAEDAIAEAQRAIEIDPNYDLAYATLALAQGLLFVMRADDDQSLVQAVLTSVARAQNLESSDALALSRIAAALTFIGRAEDALPFAERGVTLNPNLEGSRMALGDALIGLGRWDEALAQYEMTEHLAPTGYWARQGLFLRARAQFCAGRLTEALDLADRSLKLGYAIPSQIIKTVCLSKMNSPEARQAVRHLRTMSPDVSFDRVAHMLRRNFGEQVPLDQLAGFTNGLRTLWDESLDMPAVR